MFYFIFSVKNLCKKFASFKNSPYLCSVKLRKKWKTRNILNF
nr:MAG TPA: hypothetical protein [Caudoviricetes sp.]